MFTIPTTRTSVHASVLYVHLLSGNANAGARNADASSRSHNTALAPTERLEKSVTVRSLGFVIDIVTARQRERIPRVHIINITKNKNKKSMKSLGQPYRCGTWLGNFYTPSMTKQAGQHLFLLLISIIARMSSTEIRWGWQEDKRALVLSSSPSLFLR